MPDTLPKRRPFPRHLPPDATAQEQSVFLADLLEWLARTRLTDLRGAGFTDADLFSLRRIGQAYRAGAQTPDTHQALYGLLAKLDATDLQV